MSDHGKPIDTLPTKNASELNLLDTLLGVAAGGDPAAFQTPLGELITAVIGPIHENERGSFIRLDNGWQVAWGVTDSHVCDVGSGAVVRTNTQAHTLPAPFLPGEVTVVGSPNFTVGNPMGHYIAVNGEATGITFRLYGNTSGSASLAFLAVGRWK